MAFCVKVVFLGYVAIQCFALADNEIARSDINGQTLIELGRKLNKPVLTILGMAVSNLHQCSEWTQWTGCDASKLGYFGSRNRTRECKSDDANKLPPKTETDFTVCEGGIGVQRTTGCPANYTITTNGFCIRMYETSKNHDDAEIVCNNDGGFLININSDLKYADVNSVLVKYSAIDIFIGGRRRDSASQWEYKYGENTGFFKWYDGYPKSNGNLCLAIEKKTINNLENYLWWNSSCATKYPFICEIQV